MLKCQKATANIYILFEIPTKFVVKIFSRVISVMYKGKVNLYKCCFISVISCKGSLTSVGLSADYVVNKKHRKA